MNAICDRRSSSYARSSGATATCCSTPAPAAARPRCWWSASSRAVLEDGIEVGAILAITFTEKAAAELRDRIRARLRELGAARGGARHRGRVHLDDPRLLRARAARARARRRARSRRSSCSTAPEAEPAGRRGVRRGARGAGRRRRRRRSTLIAAYGAGAAARRRSVSVYASCARAGCTAGAAAGCRRRPGPRARRAELAAAARLAWPPSSARSPSRARRWSRRSSGSSAAPALVDGRACGRPSSTAVTLPGGNGAALQHRRLCGLHRGARALRASAARASRAPGRATCSTGCCAASAVATRSASAAVSGARLRGPRAADPRPAGAPTTSCASATPTRFERDHGRRAPGHQPRAARADRVDRPRQPVHGRRRAAVDLRLPPRRRGAVRAARRAAASARRARRRCRPTSARAPRSSARSTPPSREALGDRFRPLAARGGADGGAGAPSPGSSCCSPTRAPTGSSRGWRRRGGWPRRGRWPAGSRELVAAGAAPRRDRRADARHDRPARLRARARGPRACRPT